MSRRSDRLLAVGYSRANPKMSYRETAVNRVFRKRRSIGGIQSPAYSPGTGRNISPITPHSDPDGAHVHWAAANNYTSLYWPLTLVLLLNFSFWFTMMSRTALTYPAPDNEILPRYTPKMGFNAELMTQILQDFEIKLQRTISKMEERSQTKSVPIDAEIDDSLRSLQRQQLSLEQQVVELGRASLSIDQQLKARLAAQQRSLTKMKLALDTWTERVNKLPPAPLGGITAELQDNLDQWFQEKLGQRSGHPVADKMADFALESQGGRVLSHLCSPSYQTKASTLWSSTSCHRPENPSTVIQGHPELLPGQCWAFAGGRGHMVISLSHAITISHVTLDHIPPHKTPTGRIDSAPKNFIVYGMEDCESTTEGTLLGNFVYEEEGEPSQTFTLHNQDAGVFKVVKLVVQTNWGHPDHTCLYRFRVHGKIPSRLTPETGSL